jgi:hypothetical protein
VNLASRSARPLLASEQIAAAVTVLLPMGALLYVRHLRRAPGFVTLFAVLAVAMAILSLAPLTHY